MTHLLRSVRLCAALNRNGLQLREMGSYKNVWSEPARKKYGTVEKFDSVSKNAIHRVNFENEKGVMREMGEMGSLLYPGSLSTVSGKKEKQLPLSWLVDLENKQTTNKLSILKTKCPEILHKTLAAAYPLAEYMDLSIIQLSYENYEFPKHGRNDCLIVANRIVMGLSKLDKWTYFSAVNAPMHPDDKYLFLFNGANSKIREDLAENVHVKVTSENGCKRILYPPFNDSVGIIYTNATVANSDLKIICPK